MVRSSTGPSSGLGATTDLVWPCLEDPRKVRFILRDEKECQLWDVLGGRGLAMESDLTQTSMKLEEALERVKSIQQAVTVDLPHVTEVSFLRLSLTLGLSSVASACLLLVLQGLEEMSSRKSRFLQMEHAREPEMSHGSLSSSWSPPTVSPKTERWR